ncbi:GDSL-type esterase/lipase family protein [Horticoccus sp. 23ND18S-11]|uniref:GDSL-type esterase/lipase family protein n=1 Tax=Horticoccus sp. 23ND18S-11 TaxID=3391832 RepID=UPI0039C918F4
MPLPRLHLDAASVCTCATPLILLALVVAGTTAGAADAALAFDFTPGAAAPGHVQVTPGTLYSRERGHGFEPGATVTAMSRSGSDALHDGFVTSPTPFHFTVRLPREGNYRVTVTLGDAAGASTTTIKAELRRLMVETVKIPQGDHTRVSFIVNTRTPRIQQTGTIAAGEVRLKAPRESTQEAWAWDDALTLEFADAQPALCAVVIEPVQVPTVFLLGDSTVCDQMREPYASWGQMITRWFKPVVAVANHGESGETYRDSIGRRRLDKILSVMQPGDWLIMQFGHNDQKQIAAKSGAPFTTYKEELKRHVDGARARGGIPVIVSPMERRGFDDAGQVRPSLIEYADAARQAAQELQVAFIDLNAMSKVLYAALGPEKSTVAFATPGGKVDNTHHNNYGSYQLAKCIVQAIREQRLPLGLWIVDDFTPFNPAQPDDPATFTVPASGEFTNQRPLGDEPNATTR